MRKLYVLLLLISLCSFASKVKAQYLLYEPASEPVKLDDAWYKATVYYNNTRTYTKATYTLKVKVEYGKVTTIDFNNGGSVHTGYNNEGYLYSGGTLTYKKDYAGEIVGVTTRVMISDPTNGIRYFDVLIQ